MLVNKPQFDTNKIVVGNCLHVTPNTPHKPFEQVPVPRPFFGLVTEVNPFYIKVIYLGDCFGEIVNCYLDISVNDIINNKYTILEVECKPMKGGEFK